MTIRPVQTANGWEVLEHRTDGQILALPMGMRIQSSTKDMANMMMHIVAEQLGSMGTRVECEEV